MDTTTASPARTLLPLGSALDALLACHAPLEDHRTEANLLKQVAAGRLATALLADDTDTARHEQLHQVAAAGQLAVDQLVRGHLRLVVHVAARFARRKGFGHDMADLVAEGVEGLLGAIEGYDPARGTRLATFAVPHVTKAVSLATARTDAPVRLPQWMHELRIRVARTAARLETQLQRPPTAAELADELDIDHDTLAAASTRYRTAALPGSEDPTHDQRRRAPAHLAVLVDTAADPARTAQATDTAQRVRQHLDRLPAQHAEVLARRFGLLEDGPQPLAVVAHQLGLHRTQVHRIERRALSSMRALLDAPTQELP